MPTISMFYGLLIQMYFYDDKRHKEDLMANWKLAVAGDEVFKIDPLK